MIFVGDCHGKTNQLAWMLKHNPKLAGKTVFQLGDMGLGFQGVSLPEYPRGQLLFIRGNHDDPAKCRQHPNYAGDAGYFPENGIFYLGGAWSIDQQWRTEGVSWWRDEELSIYELNQAQELYIESKPRIVATHEAPSVAAITMLSGLIIPSTDANPTNVVKGQDYYYYKEKKGCGNTRTSQALQQMFEIHQPEIWVFGHYHLNKTFVVGNTEFSCLAELSTKEIST